MNVEEWFKNGTGFNIKKLRYLKPPKLPYFLYTNKKEYRGADQVINIAENNITIERYSTTNNENDIKDIEKINKFLNDNYYTYDLQEEWLNAEGLYGAFWILDPIVEKIRKEEYKHG